MHQKNSKSLRQTNQKPVVRSSAFCLVLALPLVLSACGKTELQQKQDQQVWLHSELNLRNSVGFLEFCADKGYANRKSVPKLKESFDNTLADDQLKEALSVYSLGRKGALLQRMNRRLKNMEWASEEEKQAEQDSLAQAKIQVQFTNADVRSGELSIYCKRIELQAARKQGFFTPRNLRPEVEAKKETVSAEQEKFLLRREY